jgi:hypothetical protein
MGEHTITPMDCAILWRRSLDAFTVQSPCRDRLKFRLNLAVLQIRSQGRFVGRREVRRQRGWKL